MPPADRDGLRSIGPTVRTQHCRSCRVPKAWVVVGFTGGRFVFAAERNTRTVARQLLGRSFVLDPDGRRVECAAAFGPALPLHDAAELMARGVLRRPSTVSGMAQRLSVLLAGRGHVVGALGVHAVHEAALGAAAERFLESLASLVTTVLQRVASEEALRHDQRLEAVGQLTGD